MANLSLPEYTQEEALSKILNYLRNPESYSFNMPDYGNDLYIPKVIINCVHELQVEQYDKNSTPNQNRNPILIEDYHNPTNSGSFYDAAWNLCTRGILRPAVAYPYEQIGIPGAGFKLTSYGKEWLNQTNGYECIPSEYGRFSQLLAEYSHRFRNRYHIRSQEAVSCYRAHNYLACCVMCGAASESVLLALAIAKCGNEERVLRDYKSGGGRGKIENLLLNQQNPYIYNELPKYTDLLKYWRDTAAHGADTNIGENEAFISLLLLLRFAKFGDEEWDKLTNSNSSS